MGKRIISFILIVCMMISCIQIPSFAQTASMEFDLERTDDYDDMTAYGSTTYASKDIEDQKEDEGLGGGAGTEANPYIISNYDQLEWFSAKVNSGTTYKDKYIILSNNIYANVGQRYQYWSGDNLPTEIFTPINGFGGTFDGRGYKIYGLCVYSEQYAGLFGECAPNCVVTIKNLTLENCYIDKSRLNSRAIGGIVAKAESLIMDNCTVSGRVGSDSQTFSNVGGLVGLVETSEMDDRNSAVLQISNCTNNADVYGSNKAGGIIGDFHSSTDNSFIENCTNTGDIYCTGGNDRGIKCALAGGIAGWYVDCRKAAKLSNTGNIFNY